MCCSRCVCCWQGRVCSFQGPGAKNWAPPEIPRILQLSFWKGRRDFEYCNANCCTSGVYCWKTYHWWMITRNIGVQKCQQRGKLNLWILEAFISIQTIQATKCYLSVAASNLWRRLYLITLLPFISIKFSFINTTGGDAFTHQRSKRWLPMGLKAKKYI